MYTINKLFFSYVLGIQNFKKVCWKNRFWDRGVRFLRDFSFLEGVMKHHREVLHKVAELGREEFKTSEYIRSYLDKLGVEYD